MIIKTFPLGNGLQMNYSKLLTLLASKNLNLNLSTE